MLVESTLEKGLEEAPICLIPSLSFPSADQAVTLDNVGEAFVDDSNLGCTSSLPLVSHQVSTADQNLHSLSALGHLQNLAQRWERALFTTGGAINFQKSFWFVFHWRWKNGIAKLVLPPATLQLRLTEGNNINNPVIVPMKSVHDTYRTLGVQNSRSPPFSIRRYQSSCPSPPTKSQRLPSKNSLVGLTPRSRSSVLQYVSSPQTRILPSSHGPT